MRLPGFSPEAAAARIEFSGAVAVASVRAVLFAALALAVACSGRSSDVRYLSIATGGTGGVYYPYGGGIAKILNESLPGVRATAEVTSASVDNLKLIRDGRADLAFTLADTLAEAVGGRGPFAGRPVPAASLAVLYTNYTHVVALGSSNIRSIADLAWTGRVDGISGQRHRDHRHPHSAGGRPRSRSATSRGRGSACRSRPAR